MFKKQNNITFNNSGGFFNFVIKATLYCLFILYLLYHIFSGEYGLYSYLDINNEIIKKQNKLNQVKYEYNIKKEKINRLKIDNLDLDLFEEELKKNTGLVSNNEIMIFINELDKIK